MGKIKNIVGNKYNRWKVLSFEGTKNKISLWKCRCKCGTEKILFKTTLTQGSSKSCGCYKAEMIRKKLWKGYGDIPSVFFSRLKRSASNRKIELNVSIKEIWDLFENQNGKCRLSGLDISFGNERIGSNNRICTASLDRIDSSIGYYMNNIQLLHKDINNSKLTRNNNEYINMCLDVTKNFNSSYSKITSIKNNNELIGKKLDKLTVIDYDNRNKNGIIELLCLCDCGKSCVVDSNTLNANSNLSCCDCDNKEKHNNWRGYKDLSLSTLSTIKCRAKRNNTQIDLDLKKLWNLYIKQNKKCILSDKPIYFETKRRGYLCTTASLDRIDSFKGYIDGNIQWVHKMINVAKWDFSQDYFIQLCSSVVINNISKQILIGV